MKSYWGFRFAIHLYEKFFCPKQQVTLAVDGQQPMHPVEYNCAFRVCYHPPYAVGFLAAAVSIVGAQWLL